METLAAIIIGMIVVSIPFLYYWIKSLKFGPKKDSTDRSRSSRDGETGDINISICIS